MEMVSITLIDPAPGVTPTTTVINNNIDAIFLFSLGSLKFLVYYYCMKIFVVLFDVYVHAM